MAWLRMCICGGAGAGTGAGGESSPRLAAVLLSLGYVYSRSGRITFAEGLYR